MELIQTSQIAFVGPEGDADPQVIIQKDARLSPRGVSSFDRLKVELQDAVCSAKGISGSSLTGAIQPKAKSNPNKAVTLQKELT